MIRRMLITAALLATALCAETVYVSRNGKTFHKTTDCGVLRRSSAVLQAERSTAEQHGLKTCRSCYAVKKADNSAWAKGAK